MPEFVKKVEKAWGGVDILINNGGMSYRGEALNTGLDVDIKVMATNYFGQIALTKGKKMQEYYIHLFI